MSTSDPYEPTLDHDGRLISRTDRVTDECPKQIGRYRIQRALGAGGFGRVYLAHDGQLDRMVAVKVPHPEMISRGMSADPFLEEARTVASLDHPHIVPVFDVGSTEEFPCFVVTKYVEGSNLATSLKQHRMSITEATQTVATVADALHHAHKLGLVHRDVKPGNILIGRDGKPYVADFGLALRENSVGKGSRWAGTPAYMSPEQARGEGHRVDGRSDVFSLGAVFYELLVGRPPFRGDSNTEILEQVVQYEPRPIRQFDENVPRELERICHKALAKRASDRYSSAHDMAEDLRQFLADQSLRKSDVSTGSSEHQEPESRTAAQPSSTVIPDSALSAPATTPPSSTSQQLKIVPKGLRAFDAHDADFFLELLPGPRDRHGLPDGLRFWKALIEETDADETFAVGLVYGPSGCGKSSFIKAGLLPRLSEEVIAIYVEATPNATESRLLRSLQKRCPALDEHLALPAAMSALRRGQAIPVGKKVLIVLDQFEQWLHAANESESSQLVHALRQCDGSHVQCLLLVRDDFWMAVTRFMRELEIRVLEGENSAAVDLFPLRHAEKVLAAFGRAFDALPPDAHKASHEQKDFLKQAVSGLAEEGKVICVRLALFAEMMKGRPWTTAALKEVGGTQGVGVTFLEESFTAASASPHHRLHRDAARAVLQALLPESGADIKGQMKSYAELMEVSGYAQRPEEFEEVIRLLDNELRLITPTDPESSAAGRSVDSQKQSETRQKYYQLTHDYLVPTLHEWLTRKQKETRRGRAELRLAELSAYWNTNPENRLLPGWWEWASIRVLTDQRKWTAPQRKMMVRAGRLFAFRGGLSILGIALAICVGLLVVARVRDDQNSLYSDALVDSLSAANTADMPALVGEIREYEQWTVPRLKALVSTSNVDSKEYLHACLILVRDDPSLVDSVITHLLKEKVDAVPVIIQSLEPHAVLSASRLWEAIEHGSIAERVRAAAAMAAFDPADERWPQCADDVAAALVAVPPGESDEWIELLSPLQQHLVPSLDQRFRDRSPARDEQRPIAAAALAVYLQNEPERISELILLAENQGEFQPLLNALSDHRSAAEVRMQLVLEQGTDEVAKPDERDALFKKQSNAAICLLELNGTDKVWARLGHGENPTMRSYVIDRYARLGANHRTLTARIAVEPDSAVRYALILMLGQFDLGEFSSEEREQAVEQLTTLFRDDPSAAVHVAAKSALGGWQQQEQLVNANRQLRSLTTPGAGWFVNSQEQSFAVLDVVTAPFELEAGAGNETLRGDFAHQIAIGMHEVTLAEYMQFRPDHNYDAQYAPDLNCPVSNVSWYDAVAFCNWLNASENIPPEDWCYLPNESGDYAAGMRIAEDYLTRAGYRLPTEVEWAFVCRSNAITDFGFGEPVELLDRYCWYLSNANSHSWPVGTRLPNEMGTFDMHGSVWEWCHSLAFLP